MVLEEVVHAYGDVYHREIFPLNTKIKKIKKRFSNWLKIPK
jgi:hypothetical protein